MSHIAIIGGHGKIALLLTPILVGQGHRVASIIRNPEHSGDVAAAGAEPVVADIETLSTDEIAQLLAGTDAAVWSAGAGGGDPKRTYAVDRDAAIRATDAAKLAGVSRFVMVSYFDAAKDHGVPEDNSFFAYAEAKAAADEYLRQTDLDWTIIAPSRLTLDDPSGTIALGAPQSSETSRANVAQVIAETVDRPNTYRATLRFNDGDTPIAEAIAGL